MYGFGTNFIHCTIDQEPTNGYRSEGWMISNVIAVYFDTALKIDYGTAIFASSCVFDFCRKSFYEFTNGGNSIVVGCWFANTSTTPTSPQMAIVATTSYVGLIVKNNHFINNNGNSVSECFSHNGSSVGTIVSDNYLMSFSGGVILNNASKVQNNVIVGGAALKSAGRVEIDGVLISLLNDFDSWGNNKEIGRLDIQGGPSGVGIRGYWGSQSDRAGTAIYTSIGGVRTDKLILSPDGGIMLVGLPTDAASAGSNGLYAGGDGVVKINR